jgi:hypothetical protein
MRQQKKTAAEIFDTAELNGALHMEETNINGDLVLKVLQAGNKANYDRIIELWDKHVFTCLTMPESICQLSAFPRQNRYESR